MFVVPVGSESQRCVWRAATPRPPLSTSAAVNTAMAADCHTDYKKGHKPAISPGYHPHFTQLVMRICAHTHTQRGWSYAKGPSLLAHSCYSKQAENYLYTGECKQRGALAPGCCCYILSCFLFIITSLFTGSDWMNVD